MSSWVDYLNCRHKQDGAAIQISMYASLIPPPATHTLNNKWSVDTIAQEALSQRPPSPVNYLGFSPQESADFFKASLGGGRLFLCD